MEREPDAMVNPNCEGARSKRNLMRKAQKSKATTQISSKNKKALAEARAFLTNELEAG
jgi:hypothetical protein